MQVIEISDGLQISINKILQGIKKLDAKSLDKFAQEVNRLVSHKKNKPSAEREAELLEQIHSIILASIKREEKRLYAKMQEGTITPKEKEELDFLLDFMENKAAERIHLMGELAKLKGVSLHDLAKEINIQR